MKSAKVIWPVALGLVLLGSYTFISTADKSSTIKEQLNPPVSKNTNQKMGSSMAQTTPLQTDSEIMNTSREKTPISQESLSLAIHSLLRDKTNIPFTAQGMPATTQQNQNFKIIKNLFIQASNNPSTSLNALLQNQLNLTPLQREQLTQQAVEMIKRGELSVEQFTEQPKS